MSRKTLSGLKVLAAFAFIVPVAIWAAGFAWFIAAASHVPKHNYQDADAVVVFTGDKGRIVSGMGLLNQGVGARLLISGVNPDSRQQLVEFWSGDESRFACCVDLGLQAPSTRGNALELQSWIAEHDYKRVILVTSNYHMPRARLEAQRQSARTHIMAYPVASDVLPATHVPTTISGWKTMAIEYTKFIIAYFRRPIA